MYTQNNCFVVYNGTKRIQFTIYLRAAREKRIMNETRELYQTPHCITLYQRTGLIE